MEKMILIAVDDSFHSRKAMEYAAGMGSIVKNLKYTIINVQPKISEFLLEDAKMDSKARAALKEVTEKNQGQRKIRQSSLHGSGNGDSPGILT